jgi:hypothetical protein
VCSEFEILKGSLAQGEETYEHRSYEVTETVDLRI